MSEHVIDLSHTPEQPPRGAPPTAAEISPLPVYPGETVVKVSAPSGTQLKVAMWMVES